MEGGGIKPPPLRPIKVKVTFPNKELFCVWKEHLNSTTFCREKCIIVCIQRSTILELSGFKLGKPQKKVPPLMAMPLRVGGGGGGERGRG